MLCPTCKCAARAGRSDNIEKDGAVYRRIRLFCKTKGCPKNNGEPIAVTEIKVKEVQ